MSHLNTDDININNLVEALPNLGQKDQVFANSLLGQYRTRGRLSAKQWPWITKLVEKANQPRQERPSEKESVGDFAGVFGLLQRANANLKYPKIRLQTADGKPVVLGIAGPRSKYAGQINVTDGGRFGENTWYGRINGEGEWTRPRTATADVEGILRRLADDPAGTAAEYGKLTGRCCFCARHLDDERSTEVGYGPVCAGHYGLPWGSR